MTNRALNFLGCVALVCVVGLVVLGVVDNDASVATQIETTIANVLLMSVTGIAALVAPASLRRE